MTDTLYEAGVDPDHTPVDHLPEHAAWALVGLFDDMNEEGEDE